MTKEYVIESVAGGWVIDDGSDDSRHLYRDRARLLEAIEAILAREEHSPIALDDDEPTVSDRCIVRRSP